MTVCVDVEVGVRICVCGGCFLYPAVHDENKV